MNILIIEDEFLIADMMEITFADCGHNVKTISGVKNTDPEHFVGLNGIAEEPIDLSTIDAVFTDGNLDRNGLNGWDVVAAIKGVVKMIVAMSSNPENNDLMVSLGATHHMSKMDVCRLGPSLVAA
ncbi:MAG: hypothetical protein WC714_17965 [Candidatus Obscuribacterales bacterium]|jgi:DNA-binding response OmpR family regulator